MKKIVLLIFIFQLSCKFQAQTDSVYYGIVAKDTTKTKKQKKDKDWVKKITYGGNFSLLFGNYTYINISPVIGYNVTKDLNIGGGVIYNYFSTNYGGQYGRISETVYGTRVYARYLITPNLFALGQYDRLLQSDFYSIIPNKKVWVDYVMIGGGYRQSLGKRSAMVASIMYNLTPNNLSIYSNPFIQIGFVGGF
jgi:hypothetical protein